MVCEVHGTIQDLTKPRGTEMSLEMPWKMTESLWDLKSEYPYSIMHKNDNEFQN